MKKGFGYKNDCLGGNRVQLVSVMETLEKIQSDLTGKV